MLFLLRSFLLLCFLLLGIGQTLSAQTPKIDKPRLINYLRYAEGYSPQVQMTVDDPKPSPFAGISQVVVHLKMGQAEATRNYYLLPDGQTLLSGSVYDLQKSPFLAAQSQLKPDSAPAVGPENAPVQIYVFSDFECPYCRQEAKVLRQGIDNQYSKDVRIIFKNFPLVPIHPWARAGAIAGSCIAQQSNDAFWKFHDWIYEHQTEINPGNLTDKVNEFARTENLDTKKLATCTADPAVAAQVDQTVAFGRQLGVEQTPTLFVNGRMLGGAMKPEQLNLLIRMELEHKQQLSAKVQ
jgi:protein-disulfide isomerase